MRRILLVLALSAIMAAVMATSASTAFAAPAQKACFGEARSADASGPNRGGGEGAILSSRKGSNAEQNRSFIESC